MSKLDTDAAAQSARPTAPAPTKLQAPAPSAFEPHRPLGPHPALTELTEAEAAAGAGLRRPHSSPAIHARPHLLQPTGSLETAAGAVAGAAVRTMPAAAAAAHEAAPHAAGQQPLAGQGTGEQAATAPSLYARPHRTGQPSIVEALHPQPADQQQPLLLPAQLEQRAQREGQQVQQLQGPQAQQQRQQQRRQPLPRPAAGHGNQGVGAAVLPPASQLDPEVLKALPPDVRSEIEAAYSEYHLIRCCYVIQSLHVRRVAAGRVADSGLS